MAVVSLDARRAATVGGSEAAAACGVDPFRSRVMLWAEKTGRIERDESEPMLWGKLLEPVVFAELERRGYNVLPAPADGFQAASPSWLVGHPDGFAAIDGQAAILEVKTAGAWAGREWNEEAGAPLAYLLQVQHYFALTGYDLALLACLVGGQRLETRIVRRDETVIAAMLEREAEFVEYVKRDSPPPPDGSNSAKEALAGLYPESQAGQVVRLDKEGWADYQTLKARKEQREAIDRQIAELEQRIKARMGEAEIAISPHDEPAARWTSHLRRTLNTKAIRAEYPSIVAKYENATTVRRFTLE